MRETDDDQRLTESDRDRSLRREPESPEPTKSPEKAEPPERARKPAPGIEHAPEPDGENIVPAEDRPGTL